MNRFLTVVVSSQFALFSAVSFAADFSPVEDSLAMVQEHKIESLERELGQIKDIVRQQSATIRVLKKDLATTNFYLDSLSSQMALTTSEIKGSYTIIKDDVNALSETVQGNERSIKKNIKVNERLSILCSAVLLLLIGMIACLLGRRLKRAKSELVSLSGSVMSLEEKVVSSDQGLIDAIKDLTEKEPTKKDNGTIDHSFVLKVADEIVRIENNLSRMDSSVRGYKQLASSVRRIKDNYAANGYEIVDMLGMTYHEGMKVIASFVPDDTLDEGTQIITSIIKPQINYNGLMIQAAQVTVSQNI